MRGLRRILFPILIIIFMISLMPTGFAERTYVVRVYGGERGTVEVDGKGYEVSYKKDLSVNLKSGDSKVTVGQTEYDEDELDDEGKPLVYQYDFQAIGLREAGKDNSTYVGMSASGYVTLPQITRDIDYVVAYSVPSAITTFEVQYLDYNTGADLKSLVDREDGETLDDITYFYGVTGAKITVAYRYIEGYTPRFDGSSKTLSADASQNVFPLYYTRNVTPTTTTTTTTTTGGGGGGAAVAGGAAANANNPANNQNANNQNANNPNANNQQPNGANTPAPVVPGNVVINDNGEEILDLDVPLAAPNIPGVGTVSVPNAPQVIEPNQHGRIPNWMLIAGVVLLVGLIAMLYWYLLFYRKKKKYASINNDYEILGFDNDDDF